MLDTLISSTAILGLAEIAMNIVGNQVPVWIGWVLLAIAGVLGAFKLIRYRGKSLIPAIGIIMSTVALIGFTVWYIRDTQSAKTAEKAPSPAATSIRPEVSQAQFTKLTELSRFIGKDENELRQEFDFMTILQKNIAVNSIRIRLRSEGKLKDFKWNNYTEGDGSWIFAAMPGKYRVTPSGVQVDDGPQDVCYLVTTAKYQSAQRNIGNFINSPLIPESIKTVAKDYKQTVDKNFEQMAYTLDKFMKQGDDFFLKSQDYGGQYYGVIQSDYFSHFVQLKLKADAVVQEIAKYLRTN